MRVGDHGSVAGPSRNLRLPARGFFPLVASRTTSLKDHLLPQIWRRPLPSRQESGVRNHRQTCSLLRRGAAGECAEGREQGSAGLNSPRAGVGRTATGRANTNATAKPIALMHWLCRLVTPRAGPSSTRFAARARPAARGSPRASTSWASSETTRGRGTSTLPVPASRIGRRRRWQRVLAGQSPTRGLVRLLRGSPCVGDPPDTPDELVPHSATAPLNTKTCVPQLSICQLLRVTVEVKRRHLFHLTYPLLHEQVGCWGGLVARASSREKGRNGGCSNFRSLHGCGV